MVQVPEEETRVVVRRVFREAVSLGFTVVIAFLYLGTVIEEFPVTVEMSQIEHTAVFTVFMLYVASGGYLTFGKDTIVEAFDMVQKLTSGGSNQ